MADGDNLDRWMRKTTAEHAETRWLALRLDNDVHTVQNDLKEVKATQRIHTERLESIEAKQQEHDIRFDSVDSQMQSLTQMVGQVLKRMPETPCES